MNRHEKEQVMQNLKQEFQESTASFVVGYRGLSVTQLSNLRKKLREKGSTLRVAKVSLIKKVVADESEIKPLSSLLGDQIALVFVKEDPSITAKMLYDFSQDVEKLHIIGGCYDSFLLDKEAVKQFSQLPPREVLLAQVCGTLKAPMARLANVCRTLLTSPLVALQQLEKKKS